MLNPVFEYELCGAKEVAFPYLERFVEKSPLPHTAERVWQEIEEGNFKLFWLVEASKVKGVAVFNIYSELGCQVLNLFGMSHDEGYSDIDTDAEQMKEMARLMDIQYLIYHGRPGFLKTNAPKGWKIQQYVMVKEV